jgi:transcriptional regulator with XRE-family HTH domain
MSDAVVQQTEPDGGVIPPLTLGMRLSIAREFRGLDQGKIAELLGIARTSISRYESGKYRPTLAVILSWSMVTGVSVAWLRGDDFPPRKGVPLSFGRQTPQPPGDRARRHATWGNRPIDSAA